MKNKFVCYFLIFSLAFMCACGSVSGCTVEILSQGESAERIEFMYAAENPTLTPPARPPHR